LHEAVLALEKAQLALEPSQHSHRAILVLDEDKRLLGKLTMKDILIALEPSYRNLEGMEALKGSGYSTDLIKSMLEENALWLAPMQFVCERAGRMKVIEFVSLPQESEYVDENATLAVAVHQLVVNPFQSLLVTRADEVVGILRLSDIFEKVCDRMKPCGI
jgi:CBS domain-containing protein